jgi:gluconate 2-dehydrogenase alpha chain
VELSADKKTATGVTYIDQKGDEVLQPADLVILAAYQFHNVHLMLLSGIGKPYSPDTGEGVIGKNYAYQMAGGTGLFFKDHHFNPFVGAGSSAMVIDDFSMGQVDFGKEGFIGGSYISSAKYNGQPMRSMPLPRGGTPAWGAGWKQGIKDWYGHSMSIGSHGSNMSYRDCYLDLDPTYRDKHSQPMLRMTFDWKPNDIRMTQFMRSKIEAIAKSTRRASCPGTKATSHIMTYAPTRPPTMSAAQSWAWIRPRAASTATCKAGMCTTCS